MKAATTWGIHNDTLGAELLEKCFISIGWDEIPDLRVVGEGRERLKELVRHTYPNAKAGAIPVWTGVMHRFAFEMKLGDPVIAPYKSDGTLNFGVLMDLTTMMPGPPSTNTGVKFVGYALVWHADCSRSQPCTRSARP